MAFSQMLTIRSWSNELQYILDKKTKKNKKLTLDSGIQTNQFLTNYGEVCIPRLSNILLSVVLNAWNAWIEMLETFIKAQQPAWIRLKIDVLWNSLSTRKIFTTWKSGYTRLKSLSVSNSARIIIKLWRYNTLSIHYLYT